MAQHVHAKRLSVRETERLCTRATQDGSARPRTVAAPDRDARELQRLETELAEHLAAPVHIRVKGNGAGLRGDISLGFHSLDELNGLIALLRSKA